MQQKNWICKMHGKEINKICIGNHLCEDRRLCDDCTLDKHQLQYQILNIQELLDQLNSKLKDHQEDNYQEILNLLDTLQAKVNSDQFQILKQQTLSVINIIRQKDKQIFELKDKLIDKLPQEFEKDDLNYIKDIHNIIEKRLYWREKYKTICQQQLMKLQEKQDFFLLEQMIKETISEQLEENVKLKGGIILGLKQGEYYYIFDDGSTDYAGRYELGMKQGIWNDYLGYNKQKQQRIFDSVKYLNGVLIGKASWSQGEFDQSFNKIGEWQELGGIWNQLIYIGQYNKGLKVGQWNEFYREQIIGSGEYNLQGQKIGKWTEALNIYDQNCKITFSGEYQNGVRQGFWLTEYKGKQIGGGTYNNKGVKIGIWTELHENFYDYCFATFTGEYKNEIKCGQWVTANRSRDIGGGTYNVQGIKIGKWTDLHENYKYTSQVTMTGEYVNGYQAGKWSILYKGKNIGGGSYDEKGRKIGQWRDLYENFHDYCEVILIGEYKDGIRIGKWSIEFGREIIGGGTYDEAGIKTGEWTDLYKTFEIRCQVTLTGEYNSGIKIGKWKIDFGCDEGGGSFNEQGVKIGQWTELHENYNQYCQVTFTGEYKDGIRFGKWIIKYKGKNMFTFVCILSGGGTYDEQGQKIGQWIELYENFNRTCKITFTGEYRNGIKFGQWQTSFKGNKIGGGTYNENGVKNGLWTDLFENFHNYCQVTNSGEYRNGVKFGQWISAQGDDTIGEGIYDQNGVKIGQWTDLHEQFRDICQVTFTGEYKNGFRFGKWLIAYKENKIGGGSYNEKGVKIDLWTDLLEDFQEGCLVSFTGEYKDGIKFGEWEENNLDYLQNQSEL